MVEKTTLDDALDDLGDRDYLVPFDLWKSEGRGAYESWAEVVAAARKWDALEPLTVIPFCATHSHSITDSNKGTCSMRWNNKPCHKIGVKVFPLDALSVTPTPEDT